MPDNEQNLNRVVGPHHVEGLTSVSDRVLRKKEQQKKDQHKRKPHRQIEKQLESLPRRSEIEQVLKDHGACVLVSNLGEGVSLVDRIAPEHLEILSDDAEGLAEEVQNAGAVFIGPFSPVPVGDFYAGPNHVLPTGGTARFFSPLGVYDFVKRSSLIKYSREALADKAEMVARFARLEGLEAHARAVDMRAEKK